MMKITLDFETYYDSKVSLKKLTIMEYVKHPAFKVLGMGIKADNHKTRWFSYHEDFIDALKAVPWDKAELICHNTPFDAYILTQYYGFVPSYYYDTSAIARGIWANESSSLAATAERLFPDDPTMRKGTELIQAKGLRFLPKEVEANIAAYCIQDVELTYAIFNSLINDYPVDELDIIDLTVRMFVEPKLKVNKQLCLDYIKELQEEYTTALNNGGVPRDVLASNDKFTAWIKTEHQLDVLTKVSPSTGKDIPALAKGDKQFVKFQRDHPELKDIWKARELVKSRIHETRAQRFVDCVTPEGYLPVPLRYYLSLIHI